MKYLFCFCLFGVLFLNFRDEKTDEQILGTWTLVSVFKDSINVTDAHDPFDERYIRFLPQGSFQSDGRPFDCNSGDWTISESGSILKLRSTVDYDNGAWMIRVQGDRMEWKGIGSDWKEEFLLCFERKST